MRAANVMIFDNVVSGTGKTWYSASRFESLIGEGEGYAVQAITTDVAGTTPSVVIQGEHSSDGQHWAVVGSAEISSPFSEGSSLVGIVGFGIYLGARVRFAISLGGGSPACRLKLWVTTRTVRA